MPAFLFLGGPNASALVREAQSPCKARLAQTEAREFFAEDQPLHHVAPRPPYSLGQ